MEKNHTPESIQAAAVRFVERFGEEAPRHAQQRADELHAMGNERESKFWNAVYDIIIETLSHETRH